MEAKKINHRILLERTPWDSVDAEFYRRIPMDSPADHADVLAVAVQRGESQAWKILVDQNRVGLVICKVDEGRVKEFVIQAMYADSEFPVTRAVGHQLEAIAKQQGCKSIRTHTVRHALARALAENGWRLCEVIMRKPIE